MKHPLSYLENVYFLFFKAESIMDFLIDILKDFLIDFLRICGPPGRDEAVGKTRVHFRWGKFAVKVRAGSAGSALDRK